MPMWVRTPTCFHAANPHGEWFEVWLQWSDTARENCPSYSFSVFMCHCPVSCLRMLATKLGKPSYDRQSWPCAVWNHEKSFFFRSHGSPMGVPRLTSCVKAVGKRRQGRQGLRRWMRGMKPYPSGGSPQEIQALWFLPIYIPDLFNSIHLCMQLFIYQSTSPFILCVSIYAPSPRIVRAMC